MNIVPGTVIDAFAKSDIVAVIFVSILFGCVLARIADSGKLMRKLVDAGAKWVFGLLTHGLLPTVLAIADERGSWQNPVWPLVTRARLPERYFV
jgi:Na+/H+-dicarboxylate symporter